MARKFGSSVLGSEPAAPFARTTLSAPVCHVVPATLSVDHTTVPQDAWSPYSPRTVGFAGWLVSTSWLPTVCSAQVSCWLVSPCAHSPEMSRYTLTEWLPPSLLAASTVR